MSAYTTRDVSRQWAIGQIIAMVLTAENKTLEHVLEHLNEADGHWPAGCLQNFIIYDTEPRHEEDNT